MKKILGQRIFLRLLTAADVNSTYLSWLNDPEINRFLETRFTSYSLEKLREYVHDSNRNPAEKLFGIFLNNGGHIGNVKIGDISAQHKHGAVGILIGDKRLWGNGFATEAISLITKYAFNTLRLHKLVAGALKNNSGSIKAFKKSGFTEVGIFREHRLHNKKFIDEVLLEKINL